MKRYYISEIKEVNNFTALNKARSDVERIFNDNKFIKINSYINIKKASNSNMQFIKEVITNIINIKRGDIIYFQYPYYDRWKKMYSLIKTLRMKKGVFLVAIVHDIDSLRYEKGNVQGYSIEKEIERLNNFDCVISHNYKMTEFLKDSGLKSEIVEIDIFDYLLEKEIKNTNCRNSDIVFAGNLSKNKSGFIYKLIKRDINYTMNLYGPNFEGQTNGNIVYKGIYPPDQLLEEVEGKFGLIWDGGSLECCDGEAGKYTRFNNPHKTSMYISGELPIICWDKMAISKFVKENKIGISIKNIEDLSSVLNSVSEEQYANMLNNIKVLKDRLIKGYYTNKALKKAEDILLKN